MFAESELILNKDGSIYHLNLKPEHIADTILTVGDPDRVHKISQYFDAIDFKINKREFITHTGWYKGKRLSVISTGMGTDNIEIFLTELDALVNIDLQGREEMSEKRKLRIIRIGTSGSLQADIPLDTLLVSDYAIGLDTLMQFYDYKLSSFESELAANLKEDILLPFTPYCFRSSEVLKKHIAFDMVEGITITCPGFYAPQGRELRGKLMYPDLIRKLNQFRFQGLRFTNFEMETAGYYALGSLLGHEVLSLNAIVANRINNKFSAKADETIDALIRVVLDRI